MKQQVKQEISPISHFSSMTYMWSSVGMAPYISYTIHYINDEWQLCNKCLQTQYLPEDHTGANLAEAMKAHWRLGAWMLLTKFALQQTMVATSFLLQGSWTG